MKRGAFALILILVAGSVGATDLRVVYNEDYAPLSYREQGAMRGILVELMNELARRVGVKAVHQGYPWERAQLLVRNGDADAFVTLLNSARSEYATATAIPLLRVNNYGVTAKSNPRIGELRAIKTIVDARAFAHVNFLGSGWAKSQLVDADVVWLSSMSGIFQVLLSHRADLLLESELVIDYNALNAKVGSQLEVLPAVFDTVEFRVQLSKKSPLVVQLEAFNTALRAMVDEGTVSKVLTRYGHLSVPRTISEKH